MSSIWGNNFKISIFGESHGKCIGVVIDGLTSGIKLDLDFINSELQKRAPGHSKYTTARNEDDNFEILSGFYNGFTTGAPLCAIIKNKNQHSSDYSFNKTPRPSHADYTSFVKYKGFADFRGGGQFSGRLTAVLVFAGAVAKQILSMKGIKLSSHILSIKDITDTPFKDIDLSKFHFSTLSSKEIPVINDISMSKMLNEINFQKENLDSVGGVVETAILNVPCGIGSPVFDSIESKVSSLIFSIPGVKGVEFGSGFEITHKTGSQVNDSFFIENGKIKTKTNNSGGIQGGISNGMPIIIRAALKPTPSIGIEQDTVDIAKMKDVKITIKGRHDPCIALRGIYAVESAAAIAILDLLEEK